MNNLSSIIENLLSVSGVAITIIGIGIALVISSDLITGKYKQILKNPRLTKGFKEQFGKLKTIFDDIDLSVIGLSIIAGISANLIADKSRDVTLIASSLLVISVTASFYKNVATRRRNNEEKLLLLQNLSKNISTTQFVQELKAKGWDKDGTLNSVILNKVNLANVDLSEADLMQANLIAADLSHSNLSFSNFQGSNLTNANLKDTLLIKTNLNKAILKGTNLRNADLQGASLNDTEFDENTILPDGSFWISETDISRFTDFQNPNFWHSVSVQS